MAPFAEYLLKTIAELARCTGAPARTAILAETLGIPLRTIQRYANWLEAAGLVVRRSPRSGWIPVRAAA